MGMKKQQISNQTRTLPVITYDKECDMFYIRIKDGKTKETIEVTDKIRYDIRKDDKIVGIEIEDLNKCFLKIGVKEK